MNRLESGEVIWLKGYPGFDGHDKEAVLTFNEDVRQILYHERSSRAIFVVAILA